MSTNTGSGRWLGRLQRGLFVVGAVAVISVAYDAAAPTIYRIVHRDEVRELVPPSAAQRRQEVPATALTPGTLLASFEIPRLGFSELVAEGDDMSTLKQAIGHLPDTPLPWANGNSAFAGHRDAHFRPLKNVKVGDELILQTGHGALHYTIRETLVVMPTDVWVLAPTETRTLTLITCYPFGFVGNAPKRFIVRADAIEPRATAVASPREDRPLSTVRSVRSTAGRRTRRTTSASVATADSFV